MYTKVQWVTTSQGKHWRTCLIRYQDIIRQYTIGDTQWGINRPKEKKYIAQICIYGHLLNVRGEISDQCEETNFLINGPGLIGFLYGK